jgi:TonB family protein
MIYKILSQNYLSKHYLTKIIATIPLVWCACQFYAPQHIVAAPNIINGSTSEDLDDTPCSEAELLGYIEKVKKYIGGKWQPIKGFEDRNVVVQFTVRQNGKIEEEQIVEESGSQAVDKSAILALKSASPLPPLPKGAPESIQIRYVFSWHVSRN